jgi:predicted ester cyclase
MDCPSRGANHLPPAPPLGGYLITMRPDRSFPRKKEHTMHAPFAQASPVTVASLFHRLIDEGFNRGDLAVIDEIVAPGFVDHQRGLRGGIEGVKGTIAFLRAAHPDLVLSIEDSAVAGDMIWARLRCTGTQAGALPGLPPTGKPVTIDVIDICRAEDGRLVEHWGVADQLGLLEQLGALPSPASGSHG